MKYPLYNLNCDEFEELVVLICNHILGPSTIPFAKGKDGGRDGKFIGKANKIPSEAEPWNGKIIIQAKHTIKVNESCSDSTFKRIINDNVIPSIMSLKANNDIDYYILFTNRSLTGIQDSIIEKEISDATGVPSILVAEEKIQLWLKEFPSIAKAADLNRLILPFEFDESDLREIITFLHTHLRKEAIISKSVDFDYPGIEKKNELNNLGKQYFEEIIRRSMDDFGIIRNFLSDDINQDIRDLYDDAVSELNAKITLKRDQFYEFEEILETCYNNMVKDNLETLKGKKRLVRILLHYMYCNCDIGLKS